MLRTLDYIDTSDIPAKCDADGTSSPRGSTLCKQCGRPLEMRSKYEV